MKSISARVTLFYAAAATASAALLFVSGYLLLEGRLIHGLDDLNTAEFEQLKVRLGPDYRSLTHEVVDERIRETADAGSALFFINVDEPRSGMVFYSRNLNGRAIPDVKGLRRYNATLAGNREIRVGEFLMPPFDVTIATPLTQVRESMRSYVEVSIGLLLMMLVASALIGIGLSRIILRPLIFIRETAKRISSDNLSERIPLPRHRDELADLTALLNRMFDRLEQSFEQIKRFSAEASHELKTPLSLIRLHAERLLEDEGLSPQNVDAILVQLEEVSRLNQIIEEMLFLSRAEANAIPLSLRPLDPEPMLRNFEQDALVLAEHKGCEFRLQSVGSGLVAYEERWLRQVWLNLLSNSLDVVPRGGTIAMRACHVGDWWQVTVEDEGPGLPQEQLARMFDRFTQFGSANRQGQGVGLGLAISRSIVQMHSGTIVAENRCDRQGLRVTVSIPVAKSPPS